jgi:Tn3 transposase DDE domain-containing protein
VATAELHTALADLEAQLAMGQPGQVRLGEDGELIIPPLTAEDVPSEAEALRGELSAMLPRVPLASVLVEIDARTGFTDHLVHAGGKVSRSPELKGNLIYAIIAEATNMDLAEMAASAGVSYDVLTWTAEWYFRPETLEPANSAMVGYHHRLPMASAFGTGTLASSDGQRFPVKGKSITARHLSRYFARGQGISAYTAVSDQHATLDTKVIAADAPEGPIVLDGILGNTDPPILEHATDTHGATLANFALFDLVGRQLSPRIRDLGKITLCRPGPRAEFEGRYPHAGALLSRRLNDQLVTARWDDLLRVAASVHGGHATAALVVGKLCSSTHRRHCDRVGHPRRHRLPAAADAHDTAARIDIAFEWPARMRIGLRHTPTDRVSAPLVVSVRVVADAPVTLVDHARAERPGLDQVERDVLGDRRQERRAATHDDRMAEHAQLVDEAQVDSRRGQAGTADRDILVGRVKSRSGLLGHRRLGEPGVALDAVERAAEDDLRDRAPDVGERGPRLVVAQRRIRLPHQHRLVKPAAQQIAPDFPYLRDVEPKLLLAGGRPPKPARTVSDEAVHRDAHRVDQHGFELIARGDGRLSRRSSPSSLTSCSPSRGCSATIGDRSRDENSSSWAVQAILGPLPAPHRDPGSGSLSGTSAERCPRSS